MRPAMERLREQSQADRRDAIAVLTPDQQAQAWERIARPGQPRGGRPGRGLAPGRVGDGERPRPGRQGVAPRQRPGARGTPDRGRSR
jgi:hypothetical protein